MNYTVRNSQLDSSFGNGVALVSKEYNLLLSLSEFYHEVFSKSKKAIVLFTLFLQTGKHAKAH